MKWLRRQAPQIWSGSAKWLPITQICLCIAMGANQVALIMDGDRSAGRVLFAVGWGVMLCFWLITLAAYLMDKRRAARAATTSMDER